MLIELEKQLENMGKIKKILENELVGGTQSTDVYPVTSTKAIYDENNVRLDTILKPATKETAGLMSPEDKKNIDDKLSKSEGGEIKKPIVITNNNSRYSITINPDGSVYIWSKKSEGNIFSIVPAANNVIISGDGVSISGIKNLSAVSYYNSPIYSSLNDTFTGSKFKLRSGTNEQVLLGDGTTTGKLVKDIRVNQDNVDKKNTLLLMLQYIDGTALETEFPAATKELAGLMTAADKAKLDDIEHTYVSTQNGKNLLLNAAIYVAGGFEIAESGMDNTTVIDSPDRIIYDKTVLGGRFLARKDMTCYTHWKADISKNIAPPSRYGIETDDGVFPFSNQMYKFSNHDNNIFIATCSDGKCTMKHLQ